MALAAYEPAAEPTEQEREEIFLALSITEKRIGVAVYSNYTCILDLTEVFAFSSDLLDVILHGGSARYSTLCYVNIFATHCFKIGSV